MWSRPPRVSGSTTVLLSPMWMRRNLRPRPGLSEPQNTPPGPRTRCTSANSRSCSSGYGRWCSIVRHTTALKVASANGIVVASPCTTWAAGTRSRATVASSGSISTAVSCGATPARISVVSPGPGPISSTRRPSSAPSSTAGTRVVCTRWAQPGLAQYHRWNRFTPLLSWAAHCHTSPSLRYRPSAKRLVAGALGRSGRWSTPTAASRWWRADPGSRRALRQRPRPDRPRWSRRTRRESAVPQR